MVCLTSMASRILQLHVHCLLFFIFSCYQPCALTHVYPDCVVTHALYLSNHFVTGCRKVRITSLDACMGHHGDDCERTMIPNTLWVRRVVLQTLGSVVSQPTLRREGDVRLTGASSKGGKCSELPPTFIWGKTLEKPKGGSMNFKSKRFGSCFYARGRY